MALRVERVLLSASGWPSPTWGPNPPSRGDFSCKIPKGTSLKETVGEFMTATLVSPGLGLHSLSGCRMAPGGSMCLGQPTRDSLHHCRAAAMARVWGTVDECLCCCLQPLKYKRGRKSRYLVTVIFN